MKNLNKKFYWNLDSPYEEEYWEDMTIASFIEFPKEYDNSYMMYSKKTEKMLNNFHYWDETEKIDSMVTQVIAYNLT